MLAVRKGKLWMGGCGDGGRSVPREEWSVGGRWQVGDETRGREGCNVCGMGGPGKVVVWWGRTCCVACDVCVYRRAVMIFFNDNNHYFYFL